MLAPTNNTTTPGSSSDALIHSRSISSSRAPQEANYQIDDDSRASVMVAASPQNTTNGYAVSSIYTTDSPYRISSTVRSPHGQPSEGSPCSSHLPAYSPALSSSYIPPPSLTPSQLNAYPVPEGTYGKTTSSSHDGACQHNMYQDPYQQTYQQRPYPEPELVDTLTSAAEKPKPSSTGSTTKPTNNGRRKKFIWIGSFVILILIGAIIGIMVSMKSKDSDNGGNSSDNSISGKRSSTTSTTPTPTTNTTTGPIRSVPVTVPSTPVTVSYAPVTVPTPTSGGSSGSVVTPKPLPPLPEKGQCPTFFCDDWYWDCRNNVCAQDGNYKACTSKCNGDFYCETDCRRTNPCQKECSDTWSSCRTHCR